MAGGEAIPKFGLLLKIVDGFPSRICLPDMEIPIVRRLDARGHDTKIHTWKWIDQAEWVSDWKVKVIYRNQRQIADLIDRDCCMHTWKCDGVVGVDSILRRARCDGPQTEIYSVPESNRVVGVFTSQNSFWRGPDFFRLRVRRDWIQIAPLLAAIFCCVEWNT
jgi:hypothetical protein